MNIDGTSIKTRKLIPTALVITIWFMPFIANGEYIGISSIPAASQVQPGQVYKFTIVADSTTIPSDVIIAASWYISIPTGVTITGAELPSPNNPSTNPNDFFYGSTMKSTNFVDSSPELCLIR